MLDQTALSYSKNVKRLQKNQAARYRFGSVKRKGSAFPIGRYVGEYRLIRRVDGQLIPAVETVRTIQVK